MAGLYPAIKVVAFRQIRRFPNEIGFFYSGFYKQEIYFAPFKSNCMIAAAHLSVACVRKTPVYNFVKKDNCWFVVSGSANKLSELPEGARAVLNSVAGGRNAIRLKMDTEYFEGADSLTLLELCDGPRGGAYYMMQTCNGKNLFRKMWVCDLTLFVFGDMPESIYLRKLPEEASASDPVIQMDLLMQGA